MDKNTRTACFIGSVRQQLADSELAERGFSHGLISFSIPDFGILFRCRSEGETLPMEVSAFFSLLEFIKSKLEEESIKSIQVHSSLPAFVFSFTPEGNLFKPGTAYRSLLDDYTQLFSIAVSFIPPNNNPAFSSAVSIPSIPTDKEVKLNINADELFKAEFKSFQKGIKL